MKYWAKGRSLKSSGGSCYCPGILSGPELLKPERGPRPLFGGRGKWKTLISSLLGFHGKAGPRGGASRSRAVRLITTHGDLGEVRGTASQSRHREEAKLTAGTRVSKLQLGVTR